MKKLFFLLLVISFCSSLSAKTNYHWTRMPGNDGGYVSCMTADKNGTIYAGSNALFTSTDEGETWNKIYDNFSPNNIVNLVITDSVIFANIVINECDVDEYVIYLSKDNGKTWAVDSNKNDNNIFNKKILTFGNTYYEISGNSILKRIGCSAGNMFSPMPT